jgi:type II secretory pathway component PulF
MKTNQVVVKNNQTVAPNKPVVQKRPVQKKVKPKKLGVVKKKKARKPIVLFFHLSTKDKMFFARRMEMMLRTGMQVLDSLIRLREQTTNPTFTKILDQAILDVKNGQFLHMGLSRYKKIFGEFFINVVRVGEISGTLADSFKYLAEELKKKQELASKVKGAMIYPAVILVATIGITAVLIFFIFPRVIPIFESMRVELPLVTVILITISRTLLDYGLYIFGGLFGLSVGLWMLLKSPTLKMAWHKSFLFVPFINKLTVAVNVISFARTMALLLKSGVKIVEALMTTANTLSNVAYRREVLMAANHVKEGGTIAEYLKKNPRYFPTVFSQMIEVGENTGTLDGTALFLADFYEEELDASTKGLSTILEPLLLVGMGLTVSFVALAILLPIFQITQTVGR